MAKSYKVTWSMESLIKTMVVSRRLALLWRGKSMLRSALLLLSLTLIQKPRFHCARTKIESAFYFIFTLFAGLIVSVGAAIGLSVAANKRSHGIAYRETLGIREAVEQLVGNTSLLEDATSPYNKALKWVIHEDPKQMLLDDARFQQRFAAAVFYYSTSIKGPWSGGCAEPRTLEEKSSFLCVFSYRNPPTNKVFKHNSIRWLSGEDECSWQGLDCDELGQVRAMYFGDGTNMTGTIPDALRLFPFIQRIFISEQLLDGPIPESLFKLQHLIDLDLSGNKLTGTLPEVLFNESSIQRLILSDNELSGTMGRSVAKLTDLKTLTLFNNKMQGALPTELGLVRNLQFLRIGHNGFTGTLPTELGHLRSLSGLAVQKLNLTGTIPTEIGNMKRLRDIRLGYNSLTGGIPEELYNIPAMSRIDFQGNQLGGTLSSLIGNFTALYALRLSGNRFTGTIPTELSLLVRPNELKIEGNQWVGPVPDDLCPVERARGDLTPVRKIVAECGADEFGNTANPCSCCTECCSNGGRSCVQDNPVGPSYYEVDDDVFMLNPL